MAKKKTVADQSRSGHVSSFTGGLNTDLHPMLQPNDTLTDCVNGTLITYNGNENMLQNDMGNYELKHAQLPEGYIPMGIKEHQGVLYIASWNPIEKKAQIGSYPSPKTVFGEENGNDYTINPIEIGDIEGIDELDEKGLAKLIFKIAEKNADIDTSKHLVSELDLSSSEVIFTNDFDESTMLGPGDRYWLSSDSDNSYEDEFQKLTYFLIDKDKNKHYITEDITVENAPTDSADINKFNPVTFEHSGWLGAKYELKDLEVADVDVTITENPKTSENYGTAIYEVTAGSDETKNLNNVEELWDPDIPANRVPNTLYNIEVNDTYRPVNINKTNAPKTLDTFVDWDNNPYYKQPIYVLFTRNSTSNILSISQKEIDVFTDLETLIRRKLGIYVMKIDWLYIPRWYNEMYRASLVFDHLNIDNLIIPGKFSGEISGTITNLYTISDNAKLNVKDTNTIFLDTSDRTFIRINTNTNNPEFIIDNRYELNESWNHLEIFGKNPSIGPIPSIKDGGIVYMEAPTHIVNVTSSISVVVCTDHLKQISSAADKTPTIVVIGNEKYTNVKLNLSGNSTLWVTGNVGFTGKLPKNCFSPNVINGNGYYLYLSNKNTYVERIVVTSDTPPSVIIPEGITKVSENIFCNLYESLELPTTLQEIEQKAIDEESWSGFVPNYGINNLFIKGNYRHHGRRITGLFVRDVYISPNNLDYYKRHEIFNVITSYHSIYAKPSDSTVLNKFLVDVDFQTDYKILSQVIDSLPNPYIVLPEGIQLSKNNVFYTKIDENKIVANFSGMIGDITEDDMRYYPSFSSIKIGTDCNIKENVVATGQEWTVTSNSSIDLSNLELGDTVKLHVLGASNEDDLNKFISNIKFPTLEDSSEDSKLELTIVSAVQIDNPDISRPGIKITFEKNENYNNYIESNTIEFTVNENENWAAYNFILSSAGHINTYTWDVVEIGQPEQNDYEWAWTRALEIHGDVFENAVLIVPNHAQVEESITKWFGTKIDSTNANSLGTVVLEGPTTMSYYKYNYNITSPVSNIDNNTLAIETCLAVGEMFDNPEFGIKLSTPLFKYENDKLYVKNFFASLHRIDKLEFENPTPKANIILSTDTLQENCKVAVRVKYGEIEENTRFQILDNNSLSQEITVDKSDSYDITGYTFKQVGTKILIEDLNTKPVTISKNIIAEDLSIYKYGFIPNTKTMRVRLEWPQAIDQSDCYWTVSDLSGNNVANGVVNENLFFDNIDLDINCSNLNDHWYIFSYTTPTKTYKRPLFAKTEVKYENGSFTGPNYSDYKNAYYDDFVNPKETKIDYKVEDALLGLSDMQIWHKKQGKYFTWDSQYSKESPKALWWELMDEFDNNYKYYLGTRKYQTVTLDLEKFGFVKGVTEYSVELHADGYDKPHILQKSGIYDVENNANVFTIPVGESIQQVESTNEKAFPFKKEYLIQNSYAPTEFDYESILGENTNKVLRVCDWDKGKMLCIDKTGGETNDCSIALLDPKEYNPDSDSFKNGKIISGEGNFVSKILSKVNNLFVPIVVRIKTDDNGFVFPVVKNLNWSYKATWDEARGKKNSDNKRSVWSSNDLGAIVHTKNNLAAAHANLWAGIAQLAAVIATWIAAAVLSVVSLGLAAPVVATLAIMETVTIGVAGATQLSLGIAEFKKKEKVFKLFALRGKSNKGGQQKDLLVLPLWGKQEEHESKRRHFEGQVRYENADWSIAEKLMLYLGSRIYARVYSDNSRYIPKFNEENVINNKAFKLTVRFKNIDKKSGGISLKSLEKIFSTIYGIQTNNFKLKVSEIEDVDVNFKGKFDIKNKWKEVLDGESEYSTLDYQIKNWCSTDKSGNSVPVVEDMDVDSKIENFVTCLAFDPISRCFYYSEGSDETWYEEDPRWAFGPNRGGCRMRIKRNFRKKNGKESNDKDWIDVGEFPRFNNDVITPIAYPILPFCEDDYTEDTKPNRSENIANTYIKAPDKGNTPVYMETIDLNITKPEDIITKDCMNYLEYIFYDKNKELQTTDSTN